MYYMFCCISYLLYPLNYALNAICHMHYAYHYMLYIMLIICISIVLYKHIQGRLSLEKIVLSSMKAKLLSV